MIRLAEVLMEDWHMYDEAATVLRWARELFPEEEDAARLLVEALSKSGEEEEARKLSNELGPRDDPEDLMTHAIAQAAAFDYPKALELMARAIASGLVRVPPTTSTSGMRCGGLNGWPMTQRSG